MLAFGIVPVLDEVVDRRVGIPMGRQHIPGQEFMFERREETLGDRVVPVSRFS